MNAAPPSKICDLALLRPGVTLVIPCCNELQGLEYLADRLARLCTELERHYELFLVLVDDGSVDGTGTRLRELFGRWPRARIVSHSQNRGLAAAIRTGIEHADTEIVCSMDSDCTYDPGEFRRLLPLLADGVDLVTASPYHPAGSVVNVPAWRLFLSRSASKCYRLLLRNKLHTYTSCFRVYRRSAVLRVPQRRQRFDGIAELLVRLDEQGSVVVEYPATLHVRRHGQSKLRLVETVRGHLSLLGELLARRLRWPRPAPLNRPMTHLPVPHPQKEVACLEKIPA
jgi:dolichol-phosphate mannosyltransferase